MTPPTNHVTALQAHIIYNVSLEQSSGSELPVALIKWM